MSFTREIDRNDDVNENDYDAKYNNNHRMTNNNTNINTSLNIDIENGSPNNNSHNVAQASSGWENISLENSHPILQRKSFPETSPNHQNFVHQAGDDVAPQQRLQTSIYAPQEDCTPKEIGRNHCCVGGANVLQRVGVLRLLGIYWQPRWGWWCIGEGCGLTCAIITWLLIGYAQFVVNWLILRPLLFPDLQHTHGTHGNFARHFLPDHLKEATSSSLTATNQNQAKNAAAAAAIEAHASQGWPISSLLHALVYNVASTLAFLSHVKAMLSDPGSIPFGNATEQNVRLAAQRYPNTPIYKCQRCHCIKSDRAHHCSVCKRCIRKMDHHCPWVNNCVGQFNQRFFILFTMYIFCISAHAIYLSVSSLVHCFSSEWSGPGCYSGFSIPAQVIFLIVLTIEGLLFGIFTAIMFGDQIHSIFSDRTGIEQLKEARDRRSPTPSSAKSSVSTMAHLTRMQKLEVVCGLKRSWQWFLPWINADFRPRSSSSPSYVAANSDFQADSDSDLHRLLFHKQNFHDV